MLVYVIKPTILQETYLLRDKTAMQNKIQPNTRQQSKIHQNH